MITLQTHLLGGHLLGLHREGGLQRHEPENHFERFAGPEPLLSRRLRKHLVRHQLEEQLDLSREQVSSGKPFYDTR